MPIGREQTDENVVNDVLGILNAAKPAKRESDEPIRIAINQVGEFSRSLRRGAWLVVRRGEMVNPHEPWLPAARVHSVKAKAIRAIDVSLPALTSPTVVFVYKKPKSDQSRW